MTRPPLPAAAAALLALSTAACATTAPYVEAAGAQAERVGAAGADAARAAATQARVAAKAINHQRTGPHLSELGVADPPSVAMPMPQAQSEARAPNSLWKAGARSFFNDPRAARIGDLLTVRIDIDDSAQVSNQTSRRRQGSTNVGVGSILGQESNLGRYTPGGFDPSRLIEAEGSTNTQGQGAIDRQERVTLTVAAVVADILPNGNFVISGRQEVRINAELRELTVAGVIRPEDIGADNTIRHDQIAEARISYGGRGQLTTVQRPGWLQRVGDAVSPF